MRKTLLAGAGLIALLAAGCATTATTTEGTDMAAAPADAAPVAAPAPAQTAALTPAQQANPLLREWTGAYGGVPPFDQVRPEHFIPAYEAAMDMYRREIAAIAGQSAAPTFENTIAAMERSGRAYDRVGTIFGIHSSNLNNPEIQRIDEVMSPRLAAFGDEITQNEALFRRIEAVYNARERSNLTPEQQRLAWLYYNNFVRSGANLNAAQKQQLSTINQRLATLFTEFSNNLLADENTAIFIDNRAQLAGLPDSVVAAMAAAAAERGQQGKWAVVNTRSSVDPYLTYATDRAMRERVWRAFVNRGDNGGENDNNAIITEILQLRAQRAALLGYPTHAHWRVSTNTMAGSPEAAMRLMEQVWPAARARVAEEVRDMQQIANREGGARITIEPWDYRFYQEKVRKARYDIDQNQVREYLQLDRLRDGMFWMAQRLYGLTFTPVTGVPVFHPDVTVYEVKDRAGQHVGLWYFDPYARTGKRSGAWMNAYRTQERFDRPTTTIVSNNSNFVEGAAGEPVLISWDDAETLFHEFGHALHGLLSNVNYPSLAGTAVARDFVEFPSQVHEHWLLTPEVLNQFATHYRTGRPMPAELIRKLEQSSTFNQGFATTEYLASALVDMRMHLAGNQRIDPDAFERQTLAELGMPREIVMRHRTPQFGHVFSGDSYSAGYYSYLWSEVLDQDTWSAFTEAGGAYDPEVARRFVSEILSVGNTRDPAESFRAFRGRDPRIEPLLRSRGFPTGGTSGER